ncbi:MAG TPA: dTDP-4-dehydrorhamnose 3,5-epimerase [Bauldia sp.]|nr:dTDP-4-dehydrorhamnose 3,5-epimerase [Bauldia sp.]
MSDRAGREFPIVTFEAVRLAIPEVVLIRPRRIADSRGYFTVTYAADEFARLGIGAVFVQDNQAGSARAGTIRGLHFQHGEHAQAKLMRVVNGAIFDVAVDLRRSSRTFGRWTGATLTADGAEQLFIPRGFAHGYCTLGDEAVVAYKCDNGYFPAAEAGIFFADPALAIEWPVSADAAIMSEKDRALPPLAAIRPELLWETA